MRILTLLSLLALFFSPYSAKAQSDIIVAELYTSQGCPHCPPADRLLVELAKAPKIIALGCHVDYWDRGNWKDTYSNPFCTKKQEIFHAHTQNPRMFTPELVVNGAESVHGSDASAIEKLLEKHDATLKTITLSEEGGVFTIELPEAKVSDEGGAVMLMGYLPTREVKVTQGANRGQTVTYANPVKDILLVTDSWDGAAGPVKFRINRKVDPELQFVVMAYEKPYPAGRMVAAGRL